MDINVGDKIREYFTVDDSGYVQGRVVEIHPGAAVITNVSLHYGEDSRQEQLNYVVPFIGHLDSERINPRIEIIEKATVNA